MCMCDSPPKTCCWKRTSWWCLVTQESRISAINPLQFSSQLVNPSRYLGFLRSRSIVAQRPWIIKEIVHDSEIIRKEHSGRGRQRGTNKQPTGPMHKMLPQRVKWSGIDVVSRLGPNDRPLMIYGYTRSGVTGLPATRLQGVVGIKTEGVGRVWRE